jgi:hypothetical protein
MDPEDLARKYVRDADALATAKRHDEAVVLYDLAIDVDPDCPEAWTGKASVLRLQGKRRSRRRCGISWSKRSNDRGGFHPVRPGARWNQSGAWEDGTGNRWRMELA